jgi:hypothetical protein
VQREEEAVRSRGYFATHVGDFWDVAFPYVKARYDLALLIHPSAYQTNILASWQEMNFHLQELMRLTHNFTGNDLGMGNKFSAFLLHEGRDDDAYAVSRYLLKRWSSTGLVDPSLEKLHVGSIEGAWIYTREKDCRYNDIFLDCPNMVNDATTAFNLVVIWLIKKRLLCQFGARERGLTEFARTRGGISLLLRNLDVGLQIKSFLVPYDIDHPESLQHWVESQDNQLNAVSDRIDSLNSLIIPSFANPKEIITGHFPTPSGLGFGEVNPLDQLWYILNDCHKFLECLPGLNTWLAQRYGRTTRARRN